MFIHDIEQYTHNYCFGIFNPRVTKWYQLNELQQVILHTDGSMIKYQLLNEQRYRVIDNQSVGILGMTEEEWRQEFYKILYYRRHRVQGLSQEIMGVVTNIPKSTINKYFTCSSTPSLYNATKIARSMLASLSELEISGNIRTDFDGVVEEIDNAIDSINELYPEIVEETMRWYPLVNQKEIALVQYDGTVFIFDMILERITLTMHKPDGPMRYIPPTEWSNIFANILKNKMEEQGISQLRLSKEIGVSQPAINKYIKGDSIPSLYLATKMAAVLNCSLTEFHIEE